MKTALRLAGRRALVTGGGDGIGRGIALRFAREGAQVVVADIDQAAGNDCAGEIHRRGGSGRFVHADMSEKASVAALMAKAGAVDILVNNAWRGSALARVEAKTDAQFEAAFTLGPLACRWTMLAALPHMKAQRWGRVINMASLNGVNAHIGSADYNVAKEGLRALTRTAAREWAPWGICCNLICPAALSAAARRVAAQQPGLIERISAANPMGRLGDPETDIGGVAVFLASDDCAYLTGNTLFVDGGAHINGVAWAPDLGEG